MSFNFKTALLCILACGFAAGGTAHSQDAAKPAEETSKPKIKVLPPAYDEHMMRLSEVLGALHYLRNLCGAEEAQLWRDQMAAVIENEEPTPERKAEMTARFNRGFRSFQETYRECTPVAVQAVNEYMREGRKLAGEIPSRFGR